MERPMRNLRKKRGQALIMVTAALIAMCGMLGLTVDLGWSFYVKKSAQAAADSAALAAAYEALRVVGTGTYTCGSNVDCGATPMACTSISSGNLLGACQYAQRNGFTDGSGNQTVTVTAGTAFPPPTFTGALAGQYWVTARVSERIPQLFSRVLGNSNGLVSARATAVITDTVFTASLVVLNRENDPTIGPPNAPATGVDLDIGGTPNVTANGPILLSSNAANSGILQGGGEVHAPRTLTRGNVDRGGGNIWLAAPTTGVSDQPFFEDPMIGAGQPPPPPTNQGFLASDVSLLHPIRGGNIQGTNGNSPPALLPQGFYYAVDDSGNATGAPLSITGNVKFNNGGVSFNDGTNFGEWVIFGGVVVSNPGTAVTFDPGRYVFAGARSGNALLDTSNKVILDDAGPQGAPFTTSPGVLFILTRPDYLASTQVPSTVQLIQNQLGFAPASMLAGNTANSLINLHGLRDKPGTGLPTPLKPFDPFLTWQDQRNSTVGYVTTFNQSDPLIPAGTPLGSIDYYTCGAGHTINNPCTNTANQTTDGISIQAGSNLKLWGAMYQPRGAWMNIQASNDFSGPIQVVTGALKIQGSSLIRLRGLDTPITQKTASLVE